MKRIIIAFVLIGFSIYVGVFSLNKTEKICKNMISRIEATLNDLEEVEKSSTHEKRVTLYNTAKNLDDAWEESSLFFYFFFENEEIKEIELNVEKIPVHVKNGDLAATYICLVECREELEYIKSSVTLRFENIF